MQLDSETPLHMIETGVALRLGSAAAPCLDSRGDE